MDYQVHETAIVDEGAKIGSGSRIWQWVHVCGGAQIGCDVSLGQNVFVVQKSKKTAGKIIKMNDKKAIVEMVYGRAAAVSQVSVPYGMLEVNNAMNGQVTSF